MSEQPVLEFIPEALARPPAEVMDAMVVAAWELKCDPRNVRIRGALHAGQWLAQVRRYAPVTGEDMMPGVGAVEGERDQALAVVYGLPHAPRFVDDDYAQGVAQMLTYAIDPAAPQPVRLVHQQPPFAA